MQHTAEHHCQLQGDRQHHTEVSTNDNGFVPAQAVGRDQNEPQYTAQIS
jgi:hypothetical protein